MKSKYSSRWGKIITSVLFCWLLTVSAISSAADQYIVVGSFKGQDAALAAATQLSDKLGTNLQVVPIVSGQAMLYRVVTDPLKPAEAIQSRAMIRRSGVPGAWLWHGVAHRNKVAVESVESVESASVQAQIAKPVVGSRSVLNSKSDSPAITQTLDTSQTVEPKRQKISLREAVYIALENNLGLLASQQKLRAGAATVRQAKAGLYPNLLSSVQQTVIDKDRAEAGFGRAPEYRTTASLKLSQVIYSEDINATYDIQKMLQQALSSDQYGVVLDTVLTVSSSYLGLLRTIALAQIFADDLTLTDSNYERAKIRLELGVANKAEVYRWETAQARSRKDLVMARAAVKQAKLNMNVVLNQPLGMEFEMVVPSVDDSYMLIADPVVWERLKNDSRVKEFNSFLVAEALLFAPELASLRDKQAAQKRALKAAKRSLILPRVGLVLDGSKHLSDGGAGNDQLSINIPGTETRFGGATDNIEWSAVVAATLPLYAGGERYARIEKSRAELSQVDLLYDEALLRTQAAVLSKVADVKANLENIGLSKDASRASSNNLQLVTDSYERGVVTNIELLDAQFAQLSSELSAANAVYDFILEYLRLQRVIGRFDLTSTPVDLEKARKRMDYYYR